MRRVRGKQHRHQRLICETKRQYDISETGGWCRNASGPRSKYHYTDNRLAAALANFLNNKSVIGLGDGQGHYRRLLLATGKVTKYDAFDGAPDINNITKGKASVRYLFLANVNVLRYVCYMLSAVRLSSVCLSSVTLVHPTQAVKLFGNFFSPYDSTGNLLFWCQKSLVGNAPFPLKFAFKVTQPL